MAVESHIGKQIREVLATSLRRDPASIKPEHSLRDDLGLDSLMTFELLYDLEKAFDLEIPNDDLPGLQTLDDVVKYVEKRVDPNVVDSRAETNTTASSVKNSVKATKPTPTAKSKTPTPPQGKKPAAPTKPRTSPATSKSRTSAQNSKRGSATSPSQKRTTASKSKAKKK